MVDGVEVSVTTSKIITDNDTKNEEMRFLRYSLVLLTHCPNYVKSLNISHVLNRRQELRELRLLQKEEQRAQQQLSNKLQQQKEQIYRRFEQETTVSHSTEPVLIPEQYFCWISHLGFSCYFCYTND